MGIVPGTQQASGHCIHHRHQAQGWLQCHTVHGARGDIPSPTSRSGFPEKMDLPSPGVSS